MRLHYPLMVATKIVGLLGDAFKQSRPLICEVAVDLLGELLQEAPDKRQGT